MNYRKNRRRKKENKARTEYIEISDRKLIKGIIIAVLLILVSCLMFVLLHVVPMLSVSWFILLSIIFFFGRDVSVEFAKEYLKKPFRFLSERVGKTTNTETGNTSYNTKGKNEQLSSGVHITKAQIKNTFLRYTFLFACVILSAFITVGNIVSTAYAFSAYNIPNPPSSGNNSSNTLTLNQTDVTKPTEKETDHIGQIDYCFPGILNWNDFYFRKEKNSLQLCENLYKSLDKQKRIDPTPDDVLNKSKEYGGRVNAALNSLKHLKSYYIKESDCYSINAFSQKYYNTALNTRLEMDRCFITPENRKEIANIYFLSGIYGIDGRKLDCLKEALRYAWGALAMRIVWKEYMVSDIERLEDIYNYILEKDITHEKQIKRVIDALNLLKIRIRDCPFQNKSVSN